LNKLLIIFFPFIEDAGNGLQNIHCRRGRPGFGTGSYRVQHGGFRTGFTLSLKFSVNSEEGEQACFPYPLSFEG
jgi:hypothetical protein